MNAARRFAVIAFLLPAVLLGCAGPTRQVDFTVLESGILPARNAVVRAAPIGVGTVPLPVSLESLEEFATAKGDVALTDDSGWVTLTLYSRRRHVIEVLPPIGMPRDGEPAQWILEADGETLVRDADSPRLWCELKTGKLMLSGPHSPPPHAASPPASSSDTSPSDKAE